MQGCGFIHHAPETVRFKAIEHVRIHGLRITVAYIKIELRTRI